MTALTRPRPRLVRPRDVADLTAMSGFPSISVLVGTHPAPRMTASDARKLEELLADVDEQLGQRRVLGRGRLMRKLQALVLDAAAGPTDRGLAIYVNLTVDRTFRLPVPLAPRALVEGTFATRPLLTSLLRQPPHVLLVVHPTCAHLYQAADGGLRGVGHRDLFRGRASVTIPVQGRKADGTRHAGPAADDATDAFLRAVDVMLGSYRAEHPSPLVLGGDPALLDRFCAVSQNLHRLAGRVPPARGSTGFDVGLGAAEVVQDYLRSRRDDAMRQLDRARTERPDDVVTGLGACWQAVHRRPPQMLLVEEDYVHPGTPPEVDGSPGGGSVEENASVHDLVDDLMELVITRGGQIALVASGGLADEDRIALISRTART